MLEHESPTVKIWYKSMQHFLLNLTKKQTKSKAHITPLAEEIIKCITSLLIYIKCEHYPSLISLSLSHNLLVQINVIFGCICSLPF